MLWLFQVSVWALAVDKPLIILLRTDSVAFTIGLTPILAVPITLTLFGTLLMLIVKPLESNTIVVKEDMGVYDPDKGIGIMIAEDYKFKDEVMEIFGFSNRADHEYRRLRRSAVYKFTDFLNLLVVQAKGE